MCWIKRKHHHTFTWDIKICPCYFFLSHAMACEMSIACIIHRIITTSFSCSQNNSGQIRSFLLIPGYNQEHICVETVHTWTWLCPKSYIFILWAWFIVIFTKKISMYERDSKYLLAAFEVNPFVLVLIIAAQLERSINQAPVWGDLLLSHAP